MNTIILIIALLAKNPIDSDYSVLTDEMEFSYKLLNLNLVIVSRIF